MEIYAPTPFAVVPACPDAALARRADAGMWQRVAVLAAVPAARLRAAAAAKHTNALGSPPRGAPV